MGEPIRQGDKSLLLAASFRDALFDGLYHDAVFNWIVFQAVVIDCFCLLYTSDAADE